MKVGDLVQYKYQQRDVGVIVDKGTRLDGGGAVVSIFKVIWVTALEGSESYDWMREAGLEATNANR